MNSTWQGVVSLTTPRKNPLLWAAVSFAIYFASVVAGSVLQKASGLELRMGWGQQAVSIVLVLAFACFFKRPAELLGLTQPRRSRWLLLSAATALVVIAVSLITRRIGKEPPELGCLEYYLYEATMPGLGEEMGLRGLVFGFLLYHAKQDNFSGKGIWALIVLQALPFGLLHLFQASGTEAALIFAYTSFAAVALGWLRAKTDSIIPSIIAHNLVNVFGGLLYYLLTR